MSKSSNISVDSVERVESLANNPPAAGHASGHRRVCVYIDGGNFYHRIKAADINEKNFNYRGFVDWVCGCRAENVRYYVGRIRDDGSEKSKKLRSSQQKRLAKLSDEYGFYILTGRMVKIGDRFLEKGVDVKIGVDLATGALMNEYNIAYLISLDSDLAPAVEYAVRCGKKDVVCLGFENKDLSERICFSLVKKASLMKKITNEDLRKFENN